MLINWNFSLFNICPAEVASSTFSWKVFTFTFILYIYIYIYMRAYVCVYIYMCVCVCVYIYMCVCVCVYIYMCVCVCVYIYIYIRVCVYIYIYMSVCMYIYIYIYILTQLCTRHLLVRNGSSKWPSTNMSLSKRKQKLTCRTPHLTFLTKMAGYNRRLIELAVGAERVEIKKKKKSKIWVKKHLSEGGWSV